MEKAMVGGAMVGGAMRLFTIASSTIASITIAASTIASSTIALFTFVSPASAQQSHVVIITGISGDAAHAASFSKWAATMVDAAETRWQVPKANVVYLAEDTVMDPTRVTGRSTRENIERALAQLAQRARADDAILLLLIGHGSATGREARFNLPGPDLTATEWATLLAQFPTQRLAVVNAASASGDFVAALSAKNRTVVTATRSGGEKNETVFAEYFVQAFAGDGADVDKDGRVSILEAFNFARREVERFYQSANRLQTEHALLDDDGDGQGTRDPEAGGKDGATARRLVFGGSAGQRAEAVGNPVLTPLYAARKTLEDSVAALRVKKPAMDSTAYQTELERLLVELAMKNVEIRAKEGKP